jgi:hypothetical protein
MGTKRPTKELRKIVFKYIKSKTRFTKRELIKDLSITLKEEKIVSDFIYDLQDWTYISGIKNGVYTEYFK